MERFHDHENRLKQIVVRHSSNSIKREVVYKYDGMERRISKTSNGKVAKFAFDKEDIILEFNADNSIAALYLHGPGIDEPVAMVRDVNQDGEFAEDELFFFGKDHLNSVHTLTDKSGKPVQRYSYTAYGETKVEKTNPSNKLIKNFYAYTSREWEEETGDYYYRARYYDPGAGRFLALDPIGFAGGDTNLFRYVSSNPLNSTDPWGLLVERCQRPLKGLQDIIGPLYHDFVCVNGYCNGQTASNQAIGSPGTPSNDKRSDATTCNEVPSNNPQCFEKCVEKKLRADERPFYSPSPIGTDCQEFATEAIVNCYAECGQ